MLIQIETFQAQLAKYRGPSISPLSTLLCASGERSRHISYCNRSLPTSIRTSILSPSFEPTALLPRIAKAAERSVKDSTSDSDVYERIHVHKVTLMADI